MHAYGINPETVVAFRNKSWGLIKADFIIFVLVLLIPNLNWAELLEKYMNIHASGCREVHAWC